MQPVALGEAEEFDNGARLPPSPSRVVYCARPNRDEEAAKEPHLEPLREELSAVVGHCVPRIT